MIAKYNSTTNQLEEQQDPELQFLYEHDQAKLSEYLASLRKIDCDDSCRGVLVHGSEYEEGKDYEVMADYGCSKHSYLHPDEKCDGVLMAVSLIKQQPVQEDELWREILQLVFDHHVSGYDANMDYDSAIIELKQKYSEPKKIAL